MKHIKHYIALALLGISWLGAAAQGYYLNGNDWPQSVAVLPAPPDTASQAFVGDYMRWLWGKELRNTPRGEQASQESLFGTERMCTVFSEAMGITISYSNTPAIYRLLTRASLTASVSGSGTKNYYNRKRPFVQMNEGVWGEYDEYGDLKKSGSYPSSHSALGWGGAMAMAQVAPELQDTILRRGWEYGESRVIVGAHWQSDIEAARLIAAAAMIQSFSKEEYQDDLLEAQLEYRAIVGNDSDSDSVAVPYPDMTRIIDAPPAVDSPLFYDDVAGYWQAKTMRDTERGQQAINHSSYTDPAFISLFAPCSDIDITSGDTPSLTMLISMTRMMLTQYATTLKSKFNRPRPYVKFNENTSIASEQRQLRNESSYPSRHAMLGWGMALVLAQVMPDCQNDILKAGQAYGDSRLITGFAYKSDVTAGRTAAACALAKLENEAIFKNLVNAAREEYAAKKNGGPKTDIATISLQHPSMWYSLQGIASSAKPTQPGIYIHNGEKVVITGK